MWLGFLGLIFNNSAKNYSHFIDEKVDTSNKLHEPKIQ